MKGIDQERLRKLKLELAALDKRGPVKIDGKFLNPSQCYRLETDPAHVMFNTNCPEQLRAEVESILAKYLRK